METLTQVAAVAACLLTSVAANAAPSITFIRGITDRNNTSITALSGDGRVAVGYADSATATTWTWTQETGRVDILNAAPAGQMRWADSVSRDGNTVVGFTGSLASIRSPGTADQTVAPPSGYRGVQARGVSANGGTLVMNLIATTRERVAFWDRTGGYTIMPNVTASENYAVPFALSDDGNTIVGISGVQIGNNDPTHSGTVWRRDGAVASLRSLPGTQDETRAFAVSADGSIIAGDSLGIRTEACYWTSPTQSVGLGVLPGFSDSSVLALDSAGTILGGSSRFGPFSTAFIWTQELGMVTAASYLAGRGLQIPAGWNLRSVTAISADGTTFGGIASSATTPETAFIARVPATGLALFPFAVALTMARRRR